VTILNEKEYKLQIDTIDEEDAYEWCLENFGCEDKMWCRQMEQLSGMRFLYGYIFYFDNKEDATAFKLRWT